MRKTREEKWRDYDALKSILAMMVYDAVPKMNAERANEISGKWLDRLFGIT